MNPIGRFLASYNPTAVKNNAILELGIFAAVDGVKKNTGQIKVSNYAPGDTKTTIDLTAYNKTTGNHNKLISMYHDCYSSYVNIGFDNNIHNFDPLLL